MKWICAEQKGFIKGRRILEAVIALWEGIEHAEDCGLDYVFVKIDFDKAYDRRLEWSFILLSLEKIGFGRNLIRFVSTLFGHARARVCCLNGSLSDCFELNRSIRQGCPLAPLLFAISVDGLNCLIKGRIQEGKIKGIPIPNSQRQ